MSSAKAPAHGFAAAPTATAARGSLVRARASAAAPAVADAPKPILLSEYAAPLYKYAKVELKFDLGEETTTVVNTCAVEPTFEGSEPRPLFLNGDPFVKLTGITVDGEALPESAYTLTAKGITIAEPPTKPFTLEITTEIKPQDNTEA